MSDGAITFTTGAWGAKLHEVAPYVTKVNFGAMFAGGIAMNKSRFDKLPPEVQKALREAGDGCTSSSIAEAQTAAAAALLQNMGERRRQDQRAEPRPSASAGPTPCAASRKTWAADVQSKGVPGHEVLKAYIDGAEEGRRQAAARLVQLTWHPPAAPSALPPRGAPPAARRSRFRGVRSMALGAASPDGGLMPPPADSYGRRCPSGCTA